MAAQLRNNVSLEDLVRSVEHHHELYLRSLHSFHEVLSIQRREIADSRNAIQGLATPPLRALTFASDANSILLPRLRRDTPDTHERPSYYPSPKFLPLTPNLNQGTSGYVIPDEEIPFIPLLDQSSSHISHHTPVDGTGTTAASSSHVHRVITPMSFSDDMLLKHLRDSEFCDEFSSLLDDKDEPLGPWEIDSQQSFHEIAAVERERFVSSTFEVYEVGDDSRAVKTNVDIDVQGFVKYVGDESLECPDSIIDAPTVWEAIKDINPSGKAVGRITDSPSSIVQEPTPLMLAALHLTMSPHFDMTELLHHLLSDNPNRGRTHAFMHRAYERSPSSLAYPASPMLPHLDTPNGIKPTSPASFSHLRQRSFFFVFKYYTLLGHGLDPAPWQLYEKRPTDKRLDDHIDIAECGSVLALSLGGEPTKTLKMRPRRERAKEGFLFDTFGPWHLLSIQSFPDDEHTVRGDDFQLKSFCNGPYAFLELLISEYRDAGKRNQILHERITKLITPPTEFMFDHRLRDKLLFEDKHFTYIRRYFWAYNTLAVINTGIKAMIAAYVDTFTDDFWAGTHPLLWPHPSPPQAADAADYAAKMAVLRRELDKVVSDLGEVLKRNERTRKEIENLRDQLFSGSSIKESRRAIDQGDNIRILTMISMLFLPLTFVTSVFGITELHIPVTDWRFPLTMVLVCVPFMVLLYLIQTRPFIQCVQKMHALALLPVRLLRHLLREPDFSTAQDARSVSAHSPPKGRKRRLIVGRRAGGGSGAGGARRMSWRRPWVWMRRAASEEENDLGRV
ncbi:gtpase-activator for ras-like gtpase containing [Trichoderma arundinaceum]|uniref:Gtpase-activator for ras-like gtpase containing n=1 Tax=Trichoderma arundinaceum TaxID=490622 RepID=A0A395NT87_TRIAR|nr:gtpase-activator for ras-like gtpase containing [Trichoderma arundinaceum]